jgi:seryl-tRNA synthetase
MAIEPNPIDYAILGEALAFYTKRGYRYKEVPWVVSDEATNVTLPSDRIATKVSYGSLVGSAEQGFIELLRRRQPLTRHCAITPCFRDEAEYDDYHHAYFMKCELFDAEATPERLEVMIADATAFFSQYLPIEVVSTDVGYDIMSNDIELGSYGFRKYKNTEFIYGTGCALPRLSTVLKGDS